MKCTECGANLRPVVAFDIDGTLGNYHDHFTDFCIGYFGRRFSFAYDGTSEFESHLGLTKTEYRAAKLAYRQGGLKRSLPIFEGASELVWKARNSGAEVWVATTRPWQRLDSIDPDTQEWIRRNGLQFDGLLYGDDKYDQLLEIVGPDRIVAVVDDLPEQIAHARELGMYAVQIVRQHNVESLSPPCGTTKYVEQFVTGRVVQWYQQHQGE